MNFAIFILKIGLVLAHADHPACPNRIDMYKGTQAQSFWSKTLTCAVQITPTLRNGRWREFSFFTDGRIQIKDHYGNNTISKDQLFYVFPRNKHPSYKITERGVEVTDAAGHVLVFDFESTGIKDTVGMKVSGNDLGGPISLTSTRGIILETNTGKATLFDAKNEFCQIENTKLFNPEYAVDPYGKKYLANMTFRYIRDRDFGFFLKGLCPQLQISSLLQYKSAPVALKSK